MKESYDWQRVSPLTAVAEVLSGLRSLSWLLILLLLDVESGGWQFYASIVLIGGTTIRGMAVYFITWYAFGEDSFRVRQMFIGRTESSVLYSNVQGVDTIAPLTARLVGLVAVRVGDAAAGSRVDVRYVTPTVAESIIARLATITDGTPDMAEAAPEVGPAEAIITHYALASNNRLLVVRGIAYPAAATAIGWALVTAVLFGMRWLGERNAYVAVAPFALVLLRLSGHLAMGVVALFQDWNTTSSIDSRRVHTSSGLLETTSRSTLRDRVQLAVTRNSPFDRRAGSIAVGFETADVDALGDALGTLGAAVASDERDAAVIALVDAAPTPTEFHPAAMRRRIRNRGVIGAVAVLPVGFFAPIGAVVVAVTLVTAAVWYSQSAYQQARHGFQDGLLVVQRGVFFRTLIYARQHKIQAAGIRSSWFQRRYGLVTLVVMTAGKYSDIKVADITPDTAEQLLAQIKSAQVPGRQPR